MAAKTLSGCVDSEVEEEMVGSGARGGSQACVDPEQWRAVESGGEEVT